LTDNLGSKGALAMNFELTSTAFEEGRPIPVQYTGDGANISPPLKWTDPPRGTRSLALLVQDPDAPRGTFTHWVAFNLPALSRELSEGVTREEVFPNGTAQGTNDFGRVGYDGPKPPGEERHRYVFTLYALAGPLDLPAAAGKDQFLGALPGRVLAEARLTGTYQRGQSEDIPDDPIAKKVKQDRASFFTAPLG
jgi:Raf kinase inhibitor-like YbhB/YbcL family protein